MTKTYYLRRRVGGEFRYERVDVTALTRQSMARGLRYWRAKFRQERTA